MSTEKPLGGCESRGCESTITCGATRNSSKVITNSSFLVFALPKRHYSWLIEIKICINSQLEGPNIEQLSVTDLVKLERQFNAALSQTRSRKVSFMSFVNEVIKYKLILFVSLKYCIQPNFVLNAECCHTIKLINV